MFPSHHNGDQAAHPVLDESPSARMQDNAWNLYGKSNPGMNLLPGSIFPAGNTHIKMVSALNSTFSGFA